MLPEFHTKNQEKVQSLDSKIRSLYTVASGLVNDRVETLRGFPQVQTALNFHQQSILRKSGPFIKHTSSKAATTKPGKDKATTCAMSSANNMAKKRRSRGRGKKIQGLSPHVTRSPVSTPSATSTLVPAVQPAVFHGLNIGRLCSEVSNIPSLHLGTIFSTFLRPCLRSFCHDPWSWS